MARRRREFSVFNLSFLDVISCGLGAVILFFVITNAQVQGRVQEALKDLYNETELIKEEIFDERVRLARVKNTIERTDQKDQIIKGSIRSLLESIENLTQELAEYKNQTLAATSSNQQLRLDMKQLEEEKKRLEAALLRQSKKDPGKSFTYTDGDGDRQYLTELRLSGDHVLILIDSSTSMLGRTYVNVIRYRNMKDEQKVKAPKWRRAVNSVEWLTTRLTEGTKFQIYAFNETAQSVVEETDGTWLEVTDGSTIGTAVNNLRGKVPQKGTSLINAFEAIQNLDPAPDNIFLLTDGLPTQGKRSPSRETMVRPEQRVKYFDQALRALPPTPVNVLLFPMDGDPFAAEAYWSLAIRSKGSFMAPSQDWP